MLNTFKRVWLTSSSFTWKCFKSKTYRVGVISLLTALLLYQGTQLQVKRRKIYTKQMEEQRYFHNIVEWPSRQTPRCAGNFTGYANKFFRMKGVVYDRNEDFLKIVCKNESLPPEYSIIENDYGVGKYLQRIGHMERSLPSGNFERRRNVTIIVDRCNPHNYFHAMQEWYNLFIITKLFDYDFKTLQIFIIDIFSELHLDVHWSLLFPVVTWRKNFPTRYVLFDDAIFSMAGCGSPWGYRDLDNTIPFAEEFSRTFLSSVGLKSNKSLNCQSLTITLYTRRDYFFHPNVHFLQKRNTQRKFKNEEELFQTLKRTYSGHTINLFVAEDLSPMETFKLAVDTDILVGMHGCGFTNAMFMPKYGGIFEMYPIFWDIKDFFKDIAISRGLHYLYWRNYQKENEFHDHHTYIPPDILIQNVNRLIRMMGCK